MGTTNFDKLDVDQLDVAGVDVTAAMAEVATINGLTATKDELNLMDGIPTAFTITPAAGASNVCNVTIAANATGVRPLLVWLSDSATGEGLTGTTASGTVQAKAASGTVLGALTAKKALLVQTLANGTFVLEITDTAKTAFKVCVSTPLGEMPTIGTLAGANYGA